MTNFEKYKNEMMKIATESHSSPAMKDGVVVACGDLDCKECDFNNGGNCRKNQFNWLCEDDGEQELTCSSCKHASRDQEEYPCSRCSRGYTDLFEPKSKPKKTRQDELLKMFPNAPMTYGGLLDTTPCTLEGRSFIEQKCDSYATCLDCRKDYWLQEVE